MDRVKMRFEGVSGMNSERRQARRAALLLLVFTLALHLPFLGWGIPHATAPDRVKPLSVDDIVPLEPLAEMHNTFVESKPDRNYGYPWFHYFVTASSYAPYLGYLKVTGGMDRPTPDYPYGLADPVAALRALSIIGRLVTVLMAAGIAIAIYHLARTFWGHATGLLAGALTATGLLMSYYGRTGNLDVPMAFWSAVGLAIFARIVTDGLTARRGVWLGVFAGLALATKDQALLVFLPIGVALLFPKMRGQGTARCLVWALGASVLAYLAGTGMLVDPERHITHVRRILFEPESLSIAAAYFPPERDLGKLLVLAAVRLMHAASAPVLVAAAAGILLTARAAPRRLVLLVPLILHPLLLIIPIGLVVVRYFLPYVLILDAFAAFALLAPARSGRRAVSIGLIALVFAVRLAVAADLGFAQAVETRDAAGEWFAAHARAGDVVEYFGPSEKLPPLSAEIRTRLIAGRERWRGETGHGPAVLEYLARGGPEYVLVAPDWTSDPDDEHGKDCPPEVYAALLSGETGYRLVARFPRRHLMPPPLRRPPLDNPSVGPPVRIFAREDILDRPGHGRQGAAGE